MKAAKKSKNYLTEIRKLISSPDSEMQIIENLTKFAKKNKINWGDSSYGQIVTILICLGDKEQIVQFLLKNEINIDYFINGINYFNGMFISLFNNKQNLIFSEVLTLINKDLGKHNINFNNFLKTFFDENILGISSFHHNTLESLQKLKYKFTIEQVLSSNDANLIEFFFENEIQSVELNIQNIYINYVFDLANSYCNEVACEYLILKGADTSKLNDDNKNYLEQLIIKINNVEYAQNRQICKLLKIYLSLSLTSEEKITKDGFIHLLNNIKYDAHENPKDIIEILQHFNPKFLTKINLTELANETAFDNYKYWHELKKAQSNGPLSYKCSVNKISINKLNLQRLSAAEVVNNVAEMTEEQADIYLQRLNDISIEYVTTILMGEEPSWTNE